MSDSPSYNVVITGEVNTDVDSTQIKESFAKLFKISVEKAASFVGSKRTLKKDLDYKLAKVYKNKLEAIGLMVALEEQLPEPTSFAAFELEPTDEEIQAAKDAEQETVVEEYTCPKCFLTQIKSDKCEGCGVYLHKIRPPQQEIEQAEEITNNPEPVELEQKVTVNEPEAIQEHDPLSQFSNALSTMELQSTPEEVEEARITKENAEKEAAEEEARSKEVFTCPKCHLKQPKREQCEGCGVYVHKIEKYHAVVSTDDVDYGDDDDDDDDDNVVQKFSGFVKKLF